MDRRLPDDRTLLAERGGREKKQPARPESSETGRAGLVHKSVDQDERFVYLAVVLTNDFAAAGTETVPLVRISLASRGLP